MFRSHKRKKSSLRASTSVKKGKSGTLPDGTRKWTLDEDIQSSDDDDNKDGKEEIESDNELVESAEQKRKRLAKEYLASMQNDDESSNDDEKSEDDTGLDVSNRLRREREIQEGKYFRYLSKPISSLSEDNIVTSFLSGHKLAVTTVVLSPDELSVYSGSKDNSVVKWDSETGAKTILHPKWTSKNSDFQCHEAEILAVAVTSDGRYVASGGRDNKIRIFDIRTKYSQVNAFEGHRAAITSLAFRRDSYALFSGSMDRCIKHWDLKEMGYLETLFGHQDAVYSMDCYNKQRLLSGSSDRSVRYWKTSEDSHLVFRGQKSAVDAVRIVSDESFLTGGQDGCLKLWKHTQKRPILSVTAPHGYEDASETLPRWLCSIATVRSSDVAVTGSFDGSVRLWSVRAGDKHLKQIRAIPMGGFINSLDMSANGRILVAATGTEHKLGRWWRLKGQGVGNKVAIVRLALEDRLEQLVPEEDEKEEGDEDEPYNYDSNDENNENDSDFEG